MNALVQCKGKYYTHVEIILESSRKLSMVYWRINLGMV